MIWDTEMWCTVGCGDVMMASLRVIKPGSTSQCSRVPNPVGHPITAILDLAAWIGKIVPAVCVLEVDQKGIG